MFRFENPIFLWLLLIIPAMALLRFVMWRMQRRKLQKLGDPTLLELMMPDVSRVRPSLKFWMLMAAAALLIVMIARPQMGSRVQHEKRNGIEMIIAMDISNSMMAQDVAPSRLERSKLLVENLIDNFSNDKVGLVVFAGDAFVQLPITSDHVSAKMFLQNMDPSLISVQGTDIGKALNISMHSFTQEQIGKAIILITDGEDHEGGAVEMAKKAHDSGMNVFILGVGSANGAPIPTVDGYMKDNSGETVMTRLNEEMCQQVAQAGKGRYIHVDNTSDAQRFLNNHLAKLQQGESDVVIYSEYADQFQAVGIILILLLILEVCVLEIKNPKFRNIRLIKKRNYTK